MNFSTWTVVVRRGNPEQIREFIRAALDYYWAPNPTMIRLFDHDHKYQEARDFCELADLVSDQTE
jgi:hypothetical protein